MNKPTRTCTDLVMEERRRIEQLHGVSPTQAIGSRMLDAQTKDALQAVKHDEGKPRYDLVPPEALDALSRVLTFGASKYAARNWEKGMDWGRVFGAMMRHAWSWWRGEHKDPETGYSHLWHVLCCAAFLVTYEQRRIGKDDRHVAGQEEKGPAAPAA